MTSPQSEIITEAARSEAEQVPIQALIDRAQVLSQKVDWWNAAMLWTLIFAAISAVLVVATTRMVVLRAGQLGEAQEEVNLALRGQVAGLETKAASAQAELLRLQMAHLPRMLKFDSDESLQALITSLKKTPFSAEILYKKGDGEASWFAEQIRGLLFSAGWKVAHPAPIPEDVTANAIERLKAAPQGVTIVTKTITADNNDPSTILMIFLSKSLVQVQGSSDPTLPDKFLKIVVLQKP